MPQELASEFISVLKYLLPGLMAAWIFYGLTSHPKPSQFERVVQALIFTFIINSLVPITKAIFEWIGKTWSFGPWGSLSEIVSLLVFSVLLGIAIAHLTNKDSLYKFLRNKGFTTRTSHPSEWYCVLSEKQKFVILQLQDGRRLYGWPKEWPIEPEKGQFYIMIPSWIDDEGTLVDLPELDGILISAKEVKWIEFVEDKETTHEQPITN